MDFVEKMKNEFIPHVKELIEKEKEHIRWLEKNNADYDVIEQSKRYLKHFRLRYEQYKNYIGMKS